MKTSRKKILEAFKGKTGINVTVDKNLDKDAKIVHFPRKLEAANKLLSRMQVK